MHIFVAGYPGDVGGANTELWHTLKLWRAGGIDVTLIPTWGRDPRYEQKLTELGCKTAHATAGTLDTVPGLAGSVVVSFCNGETVKAWPKFAALGCRLAWVNCMTFTFPREAVMLTTTPPACMVYQSEYQRREIDMRVPGLPYVVVGSYLDLSEFPFNPRPYEGTLWMGRCARADQDKWSADLVSLYERVQVKDKRGIFLGCDDRTRVKIKTVPWWIDTLRPGQIPVQAFYSRLHAFVSKNGGARENWPRVGLECMASGVPLVVENQWGWREMCTKDTALLYDDDDQMVHYAASMAHDQRLRCEIQQAARQRVELLVEPARVFRLWEEVFRTCQQ